MPKRFIKFKLLLDENMVARNLLPSLNARFDVKHISADLKHGGISDIKIYESATIGERLIVTHNAKDFEELVSSNDSTGVIGISANLPVDQIDKKLVSLLTKSKKSDLFGKFTYISGETAS